LDTETVILNSTPSLNLDKVLKDLADVMAKAPTLSFTAAYRQRERSTWHSNQRL
jgi:hypothetical protein